MLHRERRYEKLTACHSKFDQLDVYWIRFQEAVYNLSLSGQEFPVISHVDRGSDMVRWY